MPKWESRVNQHAGTVELGLHAAISRRIIPTFIRWNREVLVMRVATVTPSVFQSPSIDTTDARWAAEALASLARQLDPDSVIGIVLQRTQRELQSLATHADCIRTADGTEVLGPVRIRM